MNLISRTLARVVSSSLHHSRGAKLPTQKWVTLQRIRLYTATVSRGIDGGGKSSGAEASAKPPNMIEYNGEIANRVNLIGFVDQPVRFQSFSGGIWAGTVVSQRSGLKSSNFWIPIFFEGDLAEIAAHHVKKDDRIHISGKLLKMTYPRSNVQIMVQSLNFVQATISPPEEKKVSAKRQLSRSKKVKVMDEETSNAWKHLLENPKEWLDYRGKKASGLVKPRHPDFKGKDGGLSLWLDKVPDWVLPKLNGLEFDVFVPKGKLKLLKGEESWKDLVQNPDQWWDKRANKTNAKSPDFKHKKTGEALWITESPTWLLSKLPPLKKNEFMAKTVSQPIMEQFKREEFWKDLVQNPDKWWDNRLDKRKANAPDFRHKETGEGLWMSDSPTWVLSKLPPLKKNQEDQSWPRFSSSLKHS